MNKVELIESLASRTNLSKADAGRAVDALFTADGVIASALRGGGRVQITGFGTFQVRDRAARTGRDPRTGQPIAINTLSLIQGYIYGADPITINDSFIWNDGWLFEGGVMTNNGDATVHYTTGTRYLFRDFVNAGTFTFELGAIGPSNVAFTNLPGGTIDIQKVNIAAALVGRRFDQRR